MGYRTKNILSVSADAKTRKGMKKGILYFAPNDISGHQVCPNATAGCIAACLYSAGHGKMSNVQIGRINKTVWFFEDRLSFMAQLVKNVESLVRKADKQGMQAAVRLNGTSDIAWEKFKVIRGGTVYRNIMAAFPDIQFYDYTKILGRKLALATPNYHLTFSLAESNDSEAAEAFRQGYNVAVVMNVKPSQPKPETWGGYPVIDGDTSDVRFMDASGGHIVALTAKGSARKDTSGFVRKADSGFALSLKLKAA